MELRPKEERIYQLFKSNPNKAIPFETILKASETNPVKAAMPFEVLWNDKVLRKMAKNNLKNHIKNIRKITGASIKSVHFYGYIYSG